MSLISTRPPTISVQRGEVRKEEGLHDSGSREMQESRQAGHFGREIQGEFAVGWCLDAVVEAD